MLESPGIMFLMYRIRSLVALVHIRRPCGIGRGKAKGQSPVRENSDPMTEAGEPSTGNVIVCWLVLCPPHRGSHGLTTDIRAQRTTGQSEGRA
jgi:hypothetical protein